MRVFSPTPMALARRVPEGGLTIGDKTFAPNTLVSVNSWVIHFSTEIWGPDAAEFRPDRWLGENAAALEKNFMPVSPFPLFSCKSESMALFLMTLLYTVGSRLCGLPRTKHCSIGNVKNRGHHRARL